MPTKVLITLMACIEIKKEIYYTIIKPIAGIYHSFYGIKEPNLLLNEEKITIAKKLKALSKVIHDMNKYLNYKTY